MDFAQAGDWIGPPGPRCPLIMCCSSLCGKHVFPVRLPVLVLCRVPRSLPHRRGRTSCIKASESRSTRGFRPTINARTHQLRELRGVADRAGWYIIEEVHRPCRQWSEGPGQAACVRPTPESRVKAGIARAKASGKVLGRPRVAEEIEERIRALRTNGRGMISIARELRVGGGTVQRVLKSEKQRCPA